MADVVIEPQNPLQLRPEDLTDLEGELQSALPEYNVRLLGGKEMPRGARGVTFWEVVHLYLPAVTDAAHAYLVGKALEVGYNWAKRRFKRKRDRDLGPDRRPKCLIVHSADGTEAGSMVLLSTRHKPMTKEAAVEPRKPRKPKKGKKARSSGSKRSKSKNRRKR
jgi:hypothetical protein